MSLIVLSSGKKRRRKACQRRQHEKSREFRGPVRYMLKRGVDRPWRQTTASHRRARQIESLEPRRDFIAWAGQSVELVGHVRLRTRGELRGDYQFSNLHPALSVYVSAGGISVCVIFKGKIWDMLADIDIAPEKVPDGYVDIFTLEEWRTVYPDLQTLWRAEVLHAFQEWLTGRLSPMEYVVLGQLKGFGTWATLRERDYPKTKGEIARFKIWHDNLLAPM